MPDETAAARDVLATPEASLATRAECVVLAGYIRQEFGKLADAYGDVADDLDDTCDRVVDKVIGFLAVRQLPLAAPAPSAAPWHIQAGPLRIEPSGEGVKIAGIAGDHLAALQTMREIAEALTGALKAAGAMPATEGVRGQAGGLVVGDAGKHGVSLGEAVPAPLPAPPSSGEG